MNHALWKINERSGASRKRLAGQREVERALEDVETLVAVAMDVRRWTEFGSCRKLCDGERSVGLAADDLERMHISQQPRRTRGPHRRAALRVIPQGRRIRRRADDLVRSWRRGARLMWRVAGGGL
jgi:hypothetical protein